MGMSPGSQLPSAIFGVERPDDTEDSDQALVVWFDHIFAADHDELLWECTAFIDGLSGVDDTVRDDREVITVTGTITAEILTAELTRWWRDRFLQPGK
jgi:hypothetical protein